MDEEAREYAKKQGEELAEEKRKHREELEEAKGEVSYKRNAPNMY